MYIHEEIQLAVIPLMKKYDLQTLELIGIMCEAAADLATKSQGGIEKLQELAKAYK